MIRTPFRGHFLANVTGAEHQQTEMQPVGRLPVLDRRRTGVLLHLGSLDAPLGRGGRMFIDWLAEAGFSVWQILPMGPTGPDRSPYFARSDFAGNPAFVDATEQPPPRSGEYETFVNAARHWLDNYALFETLSAAHGGAAWWTWPTELRDRHPAALRRTMRNFSVELEDVKRNQFAFFVQWRRLRAHAHSRGVRLFGDLPFYLGPNSAETWAHRGQFQLDAEGRALAVSGLPPDHFCAAGQVWQHPLYDWDSMRRDGFAYWLARICQQLDRLDLLRIDHFQALAAHWAVPAGAAGAHSGRWCPTPGWELLRALKDKYRDLPLATEDLGILTEETAMLRRQFDLPGMRVLQFAYDGTEDNPHLPDRHHSRSIVYTGTHDNDTTLGWYSDLDAKTRQRVDQMLGWTGSVVKAFINKALSSVGQLTVIPMQDILELGSEARLNTPGTVCDHNWRWQLPADVLTPMMARQWYRINRLHGRI